ncbi:glycosyltransferase family 9 protein [Caballeronia sp. AZ10_KS36]|uniref:glycosyltransferase family 9 protein n=1 Tax=Caballeronia sp. AZ10_KS36 TaxID=2921757 RepID=UPI002027FD87|nr:glycosyltransferase family 9 protein [Caballeronia sp. AZ10_KS36]
MHVQSDAQLPVNIDSVRALRMAGRAPEAQAMLREIASQPDAGGVWAGQMGVDMSYLGLFAEAEAWLRRGLHYPMSDVFRYRLTEELIMVLLSRGNYHEAHELHRANRDTGRAEALLDTLFCGDRPWIERLKPKMLGMDEPVAGKSILLLVEGGFGDFVLFSRYVDALLREGAREVVIEMFDFWRDAVRPREGVRLSVPTVEARTVEAQRCHRAATVFHLWARYQPSPYAPQADPSALIGLDAAKDLPPEANALLHADGPRPKVGLIWRSASSARHEPYRSMQPGDLASLLADTTCRFYSLQVGEPGEAERALMQAHGVVDMAPYLHTFGATARAFEALDLIISVDSGPAHLAAALNRPVWVLLAQACDCRWYDCARFTPWYPSMRLYRQTQLGDWSHPLAELRAALNRFAPSKKAYGLRNA